MRKWAQVLDSQWRSEVSNYLESEVLVPFDKMLGALTIAPQFVHWSNEDLEWFLNESYSNDARDSISYYPFFEAHASLIEAFNQGHLKTKIFRPRETIDCLESLEGSVCLLCHAWGRSKSRCYISDIPTLNYKNALTIAYGEDPTWFAPDILCKSCRGSVCDNLTRYYTKGYKKEEALTEQLANLLESVGFRERLEKNYKSHSHRYKFEPERVLAL